MYGIYKLSKRIPNVHGEQHFFHKNIDKNAEYVFASGERERERERKICSRKIKHTDILDDEKYSGDVS